MGVSPAQFTSAGVTSSHLIPGVYSRRNNVGSDAGVSTGNLCIVGEAMGGKPLSLLKFSDVADAKEALGSGDLLKGVAHAFNGSTQYIPQNVYAIRVNNGTQSSRTLKNGSSDVLTVKSADWGVHTNQIKMWIKAGTTGKKAVVAYKDETEEVDNILKNSFSITYAGDGESATCTINNTGLTLAAFDDQSAAIAAEAFSVSWENCETVSDLVTRINDTGYYLATLLDSTENAPTKELDHVTNAALGDEAVTFNSNLQALIDALKGFTYIGDVSLAGTSRVIPDNDANYVYFTGGTHGTTNVEDYSAALSVLETEDIQIISTPSTAANVHALISDHCVQMSTVTKKKERTFIVGMPSSASIADGIAEAKSLNTEFGSVIITGANANSPLTGSAEDISPAMLACKVAGIESNLNLSVPLTNKTIKVNSFSKKYKSSELEEMIAGGVMPFGENEEGALVCIRGITTYQSDNLIMNERSMIRSVLYMDRDLRKAFHKRTGTNTAPSESGVIQVLLNKAASWLTNDLITQDDSGNNVFDVSVKFDADKTYLTFSRYVRAPNNFTFITGTNKVYSSTVEL